MLSNPVTALTRTEHPLLGKSSVKLNKLYITFSDVLKYSTCRKTTCGLLNRNTLNPPLVVFFFNFLFVVWECACWTGFVFKFLVGPDMIVRLIC